MPVNSTVPPTAAVSVEPVSGAEYLLQDYDQLEEAQLLKTQDVCMVTSQPTSPVHQLREYTAGLKLNVGGDYPLKSSNLQLQAFNGTVTKAMGSFSALVETKHGASMVLSFDVATSGTRPLLGIQACHDLNLVRLVSHPQVESLVTKPGGRQRCSCRHVSAETIQCCYWRQAVHDEAFQKLKDCVANAPVLVPFDHTKPLVVQADASQSGLGAILLQDNQLVSSASRKLTACECNLLICCLVII